MCSDVTILWYLCDLNQKLNWILVTLALYWLGIRLIINRAVSHATASCSFLWRTVPPAAKQRASRWGEKKLSGVSELPCCRFLCSLCLCFCACVRACECVCERAFGSLWLFLPCWVVFSSGVLAVGALHHLLSFHCVHNATWWQNWVCLGLQNVAVFTSVSPQWILCWKFTSTINQNDWKDWR